jgi:hypothetical protein
MNRGFIGVKLYPTMGFRPYGNRHLDDEHWRSRPWLPTALKAINGIGLCLDEALMRLYQWAVENDVPLMAHTNRTFGPDSDFEQMTHWDWWECARDAVFAATGRGMRMNFAHFGQTMPVEHGIEASAAFAQLMSRRGTAGENLYADSGIFHEVLKKPLELQAHLLTLYRDTAPKGDAALARRMMFGTDWPFLVAAGDVEGYLTEFEEIYRNIDFAVPLGPNESASQRFFSANAVEFLGLRPGEKNRARLDAFYAAHHVSSPMWMQKLGTPLHVAVR